MTEPFEDKLATNRVPLEVWRKRAELPEPWMPVVGVLEELRALSEGLQDRHRRLASACDQAEAERKRLDGVLREADTKYRVAQQTSTEQLRALAARLQAVREEERARLAREMHDVLAQELTRLKMELVWVLEDLAEAGHQVAGKALTEKIMGAKTAADRLIETVQKITTELRPAVLDSLGLCAALIWQSSEFEKRTGIVCHAEVPSAEIALDREPATALFRIFQEALTNVARHAQATKIELSLRQEATRVLMVVRDNGRGVQPEEAGAWNSMGLLGMRERALVLGGQFEITGTPGHGTTVKVTIPLQAGRS
jgi:signal transduction histidine kinase